jgi:hypothetical protein
MRAAKELQAAAAAAAAPEAAVIEGEHGEGEAAEGEDVTALAATATRHPPVPSHIIPAKKKGKNDENVFKMTLLSTCGPVVPAYLVASEKPFKATTGMLQRLSTLQRLLHTVFISPSNISNMCTSISHRENIIDHVYYMHWAQDLLRKLGARLLDVHYSLEEHRSGACFVSLEKRAKEEENIVNNLVEAKAIVLRIFTDKFLNGGPCLNITDPYGAAFWANHLTNAAEVSFDEFEFQMIHVLESGKRHKFPLKNQTARLMALLMAEDIDGIMAKEGDPSARSKNRRIDEQEMETWMGGRNLIKMVDIYHAKAVPNYEFLRDLYQSTDGDKWKRNDNWLKTEDYTKWRGVKMDGDKVVNVHLFNNNLEGKIPTTIGNLQSIKLLNLAMNSLGDVLPEEIGNCVSLVELILDQNQICGEIPCTINQLVDLRKLSVRKNHFEGGIPIELTACSKIEHITLTENRLGGGIPSELGQCKNLKWLRLDQNRLSGCIPMELGEQLENLERLDVSFNLLGGSIDVVGKLHKLKYVDLRWNKFDGEIPRDLGRCVDLVYVGLSDNRLSGEIPDTVGALQELKGFFAWKNRLTGTIPSTFGDCASLENLQLYANRLEGDLPVTILRCKKIRKVWIQENDSIHVSKVTDHTIKKFFGDRLGSNVHFVYHKGEHLSLHHA